MVHWTKVISGFDAEDETVNFGARTVAEQDGAIYETWTRATIQCDDPEELQREPRDHQNPQVLPPKVHASFHHAFLCISVDNSLTIFGDESCKEILTSIGFDSPVTSYCLSSTDLLIAAIDTGLVHCFNLSRGSQQLFCIDLERYNCGNVIHLSLEEADDTISLTIVTSAGKILRLPSINPWDESSIDSQISNISIVSTISPISSASDIPSPRPSKSIVTLGEEVFVHPRNVSCPLKSIPYRYKKSQHFDNYSGIICLTTDGSLSLVCRQTLLSMKIHSGPVEDFVTIPETTDDYHMLVLMKPKPSEDTTSLHLMSFPDFQMKFSMIVPKDCYLVDLNHIVDHLIFLEGVRNPQGVIDTIRIKAIEESSPDFRLQRLLRRQKFSEARDFAKKFGLNEEMVFHAEARMLMERLQPSVHAEEFVDVEVFLETLDKIKDVEFVYECCKNALTRDYRETRRLIVYARRRIVEFMGSSEGKSHQGQEGLSKLLSHVSETLRKLETFEIIHAGESPEGHPEESIEEWNRFSRSNLLEECTRHLSLGELDAAALIWIRHTPSISPQMTTRSISGLLESIPEALEPSSLWPWLRHFVPSATALIPTSLPAILQWSLKKTRSLEIYHRESWPSIGLDFANGLVSMLQFEEYNICFQFHQQYATKNSHLQKLQLLIQAMSDLLDLKTKYKIVIPLGVYLGDPAEVIHLLLNKIHIEEIPSLMNNFLQQYMLNHSLKNDQVLSSYVTKTLKMSKGWWMWEKAPWDKRLSVIIGHIHNIQNRLQQTLEVLKKAPVPWSPAVASLAEESCRCDHPLVGQIRIESSSVAVKLIMKKYGFAHVGLSPNLHQRIIKEDRESMISDLLELTKNEQKIKQKRVLGACVSHHLRTGDLDKVTKILEGLEEEVVDFCCKQIVNDLQGRLNNFRDFRDDGLGYYVEILGSISRRLSRKDDDTLEMIPHLRSIYFLKTEFNISINIRDYFENKKQILLEFISKLIETEALGGEKILKDLERVSNLLNLPKLSGIYEYFEATKDAKVLQEFVIDRLSTWEVLTPEECHFSLRMISQLILEGQNDPTLARAMKNLVSRIIVSSPTEALPQALESSMKIDAYNEAVGHTLELQESPLYPIYKDASISCGEALVPYLNDLFTLTFYLENGRSDTHSDEEMVLLRRSLPLRTRGLMNEHHDFAVLKILTSACLKIFSLSPKHEEISSEMRSALNACNSVMLKKVIDSMVFDLQLGLSCLFSLTQTDSLKLLEHCGQLYESDQRRDRVIKELSYEYFRLTQNYLQMETLKSSRLLHHWAKRLAHCGVPYREVLTSSNEDKRNILKRIMTSKRPETLNLLRDFCSNFGFIFTDCCLSYLEILLTTWEPEFRVNSQEGPRHVKIDENQVKELIVECKRVSAEIEDKNAMKRYLVEALTTPSFNIYHYEVFLIALEIAEMNDKIDWISHLCFLQNYTRIGKPTEVETDAWLNWCQEPQLPPIAKWRLPFFPRVDFKVIMPELNLKTYEKWLSIAPVLSISIPNICTLAVRNSTNDAWEASRGLCSTWSINSRNSSLLRDIKKCLECMKGVDRLKYGTASLYYVVNHTPPGADLVAAAKECFLYMEQWKERCGDEADPANKFPRIKEKYVINTAKHILHSHGVGVPRYLHLVDRHEELIISLYKDESIPQRYRSATRHRPDINSTVDALGEVLPVNLHKIRGELLKEWLQPEPSDSRNDSITAVFREEPPPTDPDPFRTDDNLLRACYVVSGKSEFIHYLVHISFDERENYIAGVRFRALRVIQALTDEATLQSYTKINAEQFHQHMRSLQYLTELQRLGIGYSVSGFESCSKQKLVQVLVNSQFGVARALGLIPQIFLDFGLEEFDLLDVALGRMVRMGLVRELKRSLMMLAGVDRLVNYPGYISAWQLVVSDGFARLGSGEGLEESVEALRMLHACPVVDKLELGEVVGGCLRAGQVHFAGALLQFLGEGERASVVEGILKEGEVHRAIQGLRELAGKGVLGVGQSVMMLERAKAGGSNGGLKSRI
ncbi:kinetochore-associated protein 1 [Diachasma alloeum]|uniref:kinetochore-associated protein 1 n=1 Tax=Diachasma alloeum TaxID=454923 RepID=UPI00073840E3|nr:kinetochore-associated protein 1 [Diachasma alloeum]